MGTTPANQASPVALCADGCGRPVRYVVEADRAAEQFPVLNRNKGLCHDCAMRAETP